MNVIGNVVEIFSAKEGSSGLPRPIVKNLDIIKDYGIKFDKFANKDIRKSVMIVGTKAYAIAKENNISLEYGSYGENILLDFDPHNYCIGTKFQIDEVVLEVTESCTICNHLAVFGKELPVLLKNHRGLYCKILKSGKIKKKSIVLIKDK